VSTAKANARAPYHHGALRDALLERAAEVIEESGLEALTLRGLARDLGVSHGAPNRHFPTREALIAALAEQGFREALAATLDTMAAADDDPWIQLNAMGRGYLRWALTHRTLFRVITHPDVTRLADPGLSARMRETQRMVRDAVLATQAAGRHPDVDPELLTLYTHAVPWGAAQLMNDPMFEPPRGERALDELVAQVIELVVPIAGRGKQTEADTAKRHEGRRS
jgi:AcrR family transcriptional regulator